MRSEERTIRGAADPAPRPGRAVLRRYVRDWRACAVCTGVAALFYKTDLESEERPSHRVARAKAVCKTCPVRPQCAAHALNTAEPYGIWGGFTEAERASLLANGWRQYADRRRTWVDVA
jgi:WhiB family redox-sensing transcriptional regulator